MGIPSKFDENSHQSLPPSTEVAISFTWRVLYLSKEGGGVPGTQITGVSDDA